MSEMADVWKTIKRVVLVLLPAACAATLLPASGDLGDGVALQQDLMQLELVRDEQRAGSELETGSQLWRSLGLEVTRENF